MYILLQEERGNFTISETLGWVCLVFWDVFLCVCKLRHTIPFLLICWSSGICSPALLKVFEDGLTVQFLRVIAFCYWMTGPQANCSWWSDGVFQQSWSSVLCRREKRRGKVSYVGPPEHVLERMRAPICIHIRMGTDRRWWMQSLSSAVIELMSQVWMCVLSHTFCWLCTTSCSSIVTCFLLNCWLVATHKTMLSSFFDRPNLL